MSTQQTAREEQEKFRDFQPRDIGGSEPEYDEAGAFTQPRELVGSRTAVIPPNVREAARERGLADAIRNQYAGQGLVALNKRTGEIIDIVEDFHELRQVFDDISVPPEERLVVSCYEQ